MSTLFTALAMIAAGQVNGGAMGPAPTRAVAPSRETSIIDAASDGIVEWKADEDRGLYLRALDGGWYYARMANRCPRLKVATRLGFQTAPDGQLDRYGAVYAEGWRCQIDSLTRSAPPPGETQG